MATANTPQFRLPPPVTSVVDPKDFTTHRINLGFYPLSETCSSFSHFSLALSMIDLKFTLFQSAVLVNEGFLMGVSHVTQRRSFFDTPVVSFKTQNENHLFLPNILGHLLRKGFTFISCFSSSLLTDLDTLLSFVSDVRDTTVFGKTYKEYLYFGHSLEVLLHEAVEDQKDTPSGVAALQKTIQFIEQFPQFLDVVMSVARKTEADSWPYFFTFAGDPQELFEMSLETGRLGLRAAISQLSTTWKRRRQVERRRVGC